MARRGATIPSDVNPPEEYRRVLCIPGTPEWLALVTGALYVLTQAWYWNAQTGDVDAVVARAKQMYFEFQDQSGECDTSTMLISEVRMWAGLTTPGTGWLECDGASLLRADYPELFEALGTQWGAVDGTHFNIPDFRSRSPMGQGRLDGNIANPLYQLGNEFGELSHALTVGELAPHSHTNPVPPYGLVVGGSNQVPFGAGLGLAGIGDTGSAGSGAAHNTVHPVTVVRFFIYAGT